MLKLPISLCMIIKNEEKYILNVLNSVVNMVSEVVIMEDEDSKDASITLAKTFCNENSLLFKHRKCEFESFGAQRNRAIELATNDWIFVLDGDEEFEYDIETVKDRIENHPSVLSWGAPRIEWLNLEKTEFVPGLPANIHNFTTRLYRNRPDIRYTAKAHSHLSCPTINVHDGWMVHHFQYIYRTQEGWNIKKELYKKLAVDGNDLKLDL